MKQLTPQEKYVIIDKGTEAPFTGKYYKFDEQGTYLCKQCSAPLYRSSDKFDSGCGWPSFDDEIQGAITRVPDKDGRRTEIVCSKCGAHLGHVFEGEGFTPKDTRHCVNSISVEFEGTDTSSDTLQTAIYAGGCFWGVEHLMQQVDGVISVESGYIGGTVENPSYKQVCTGQTGHAEAVKVTFDPLKTDYKTLSKLFFEIHDPTHIDRQGPDIGNQYRSEVFYANGEQKQIADSLITELINKGYDVATKLTEATTFYPAEDYHQDYYQNKGTQPYCHSYVKRF
ncbi:MAG: bifunctional methionine sulfoxide reductase B/A protein [Rikenellaceae bacterium]